MCLLFNSSIRAAGSLKDNPPPPRNREKSRRHARNRGFRARNFRPLISAAIRPSISIKSDGAIKRLRRKKKRKTEAEG